MIAFLLAVFAVVVILLVVSYLTYRYAMVRDDKRQLPKSWENPPEPRAMTQDKLYGMWDEVRAAEVGIFQWQKEHGVKYTVKSHDGLKLSARYLPPREGDPKAIILTVHGYRSNALHDFGISAYDFLGKGYGTLMIDQRSHGESEGKVICYGVEERYDVREWAKLLQREFPDTPVILNGISMGAATVMAAAALDLPENVKGIIADCGYTSIHDIIADVAKKRFHLPAFPLVPLTEFWCKQFNGFGFSDVDSRETLSHAKVPVFLAHGKADDFVPFWMGEEIYERNKTRLDLTFFVSETAKHGYSYLADYAGYTAAADAFLEKILK